MASNWTLGLVLATSVISIGVYIQISERDTDCPSPPPAPSVSAPRAEREPDPFPEMTRRSIVDACAFVACEAFTRNECVALAYSLPTPAEDLAVPISSCAERPCKARRGCIRGD